MKNMLPENESCSCYKWILKWPNKIWQVVASLLIAYIVVYFLLTINGAYAPSDFGLQGVVAYQWAPLGFYKEENKAEHIGRWHSYILGSFYPVWFIDIHFLHKVSFDGKSPALP